MSTSIPLMVAVVAANQPHHAHIGPALFQLIGTIAAIVFIPLYFKYKESQEEKKMKKPSDKEKMDLKKEMAFYEALVKNSLNGRKK